MNKWDDYFIGFARHASTKSKDRSSKVGAVIVKNKHVISTGYNGFPSGVDDDVPERHERPLKYSWTIHAEENSIALAAKYGIACEGASIYVTPFHPCSRCAGSIVQAGIKEVIIDDKIVNPRYEEDFKIAKEIFDASGVKVRIYKE
jgi:dCMP deaminase